MDEIEIISTKDNNEKVSNLSVVELKAYKKELLGMIEFIENEIKKRQNERKIAEKLFKE